MPWAAAAKAEAPDMHTSTFQGSTGERGDGTTFLGPRKDDGWQLNVC